MKNSNLVDCTIYSPNHSGKRKNNVDRITPHCVVGQLTAESIGGCFTSKNKEASCNYGIGKDGRVALIVDEDNRSWCSSSSANDHRAITIECASDSKEPYTFNDAVYNKLVALCVDICQRYGKSKLLWIDNKDKALTYEPKADEMLLTVHRWFANKACPGAWLYERMGQLASTVTEKLGGKSEATASGTAEKEEQTGTLYKVQVGAYSKKENADAQLEKAKAAGFDAFIAPQQTQQAVSTAAKKSVDEIAREVIKGNWGNGADRKQHLEAAGYNYAEVQAKVNALLK